MESLPHRNCIQFQDAEDPRASQAPTKFYQLMNFRLSLVTLSSLTSHSDEVFIQKDRVHKVFKFENIR